MEEILPPDVTKLYINWVNSHYNIVTTPNPIYKKNTLSYTGPDPDKEADVTVADLNHLLCNVLLVLQEFYDLGDSKANQVFWSWKNRINDFPIEWLEKTSIFRRAEKFYSVEGGFFHLPGTHGTVPSMEGPLFAIWPARDIKRLLGFQQ